MTKPSAFFREVKIELSKVVWPTRKETVRLTLVVIAASVIVGVFIGGTDYLLTKVMSLILRQ